VSEATIGVDIKILDKDYRISCHPEEHDDLLASAHYLDGRMREIREAGRVVGTDRIAVLAALNVVHELLQLRNGVTVEETDVARRLARLQERLGDALSAETGLDAAPERV
jgi:cell division protein ZapA